MGRYPNARKRQGFAAGLVLALTMAAPARAQDEPALPVWQAVDAETLTGITPAGASGHVSRADRQWDRFGYGGALAGERAPAPTEIRALPP